MKDWPKVLARQLGRLAISINHGRRIRKVSQTAGFGMGYDSQSKPLPGTTALILQHIKALM